MQATDVLKIEHRAIEQMLACLEKLAERFESDETPDRTSAWQALDFFRYFADSCHYGKEEGYLFPILEAHGVSCPEGSAAVLRQEHQRARECIDAMMLALVRSADGEFAASARRYVRLLRELIRIEDSCLFPAAQSFSPAEAEALLRGYWHIENDEMGQGTHEEYLRLANTLADRLGVPRTKELQQEETDHERTSHPDRSDGAISGSGTHLHRPRAVGGGTFERLSTAATR